jgi:RNase H-fold protein (predicted Holliday junction resolvase)
MIVSGVGCASSTGTLQIRQSSFSDDTCISAGESTTITTLINNRRQKRRLLNSPIIKRIFVFLTIVGCCMQILHLLLLLKTTEAWSKSSSSSLLFLSHSRHNTRRRVNFFVQQIIPNQFQSSSIHYSSFPLNVIINKKSLRNVGNRYYFQQTMATTSTKTISYKYSYHYQHYDNYQSSSATRLLMVLSMNTVRNTGGSGPTAIGTGTYNGNVQEQDEEAITGTHNNSNNNDSDDDATLGNDFVVEKEDDKETENIESDNNDSDDSDSNFHNNNNEKQLQVRRQPSIFSSTISLPTNLTLVQVPRRVLNDNNSIKGSLSLSLLSSLSKVAATAATATSKNDNILDTISSQSVASAMSMSSTSQQQQSSSLLIDVAAQITQSNCQLLGIKSIGIDYGLVRTGLAVTVGYEPKPLAILYNTNTNTSNVTSLCQQIIQYIKSEQNVQQIIIGLPLHKNGTTSSQSTLTIQFGYQLIQHIICNFGLTKTILFFDERYTSKEAAARAHSTNPYQPLYGTLDADAACIILENYYNDNGCGEHVLHLTNTTLLDECLQYYYNNKKKQIQEQKLVQLQQNTKIQDRLRKIQEEKQNAIRIQQQQQLDDDDTIKRKKKKKKKR